MTTSPIDQGQGGTLAEIAAYTRLISRRRWASLVIVLATINLLFTGILFGVMDHGRQERPLFLALLSMWAHGEILAAALITNFFALVLVLSGPGAHLHAIRTRFGSAARVTPYRGAWPFSRPPRWYFAAYHVVDPTGTRHAVLTLGADIKETVPIPAATPVL